MRKSGEALNFSINGFVTSYFDEESNDGSQSDIVEHSIGGLRAANSHNQLMDQLMDEFTDACMCSRCVRERDDKYRQLIFYKISGTHQIPIEERINATRLETVLNQELTNRGIDTEYKHGVYSKHSKDFVIVEGHYVVDDVKPEDQMSLYPNMYNSKYRVEVFTEDMPPPGLLMIHFPSRTSFVWQSLWLNFLGSIIFTGLILFCFAYTINVIFRQKKISEMKTDFINNMTHEFKTPIATISLAADSITSPMISSKPDKVKRFAGIIKQENKRMNSQVEKVLQMAVIDKQDFSLKLTSINIHDVLSQAAEYINLQVEKKEGTVKTIFEATNPTIEGDLTHISNVINNLLDNANKYSPQKPEISLHTRNVNNGVQVIVEDKGIGMSKEARKHIFDKFYRVHTGNLHDVKGFGLGLSYVKAMMDAHKGMIDVKSELGKGSSFILYFPFRVE